MSAPKPLVVFFCDEPEMVNLVQANLAHAFEVNGVSGVADLDAALETLHHLRPDFVLLDPDLVHLDARQLHSRMQADKNLATIQILVVSE